MEYQEVVGAYLGGVQERAPDLLAGLYLHGSIALDAFEASSDVDFVAVLARRAGPADLAALADAHQTVARRYPKHLMDGCYLQLGDLGCSPREIEPFPFCADGKLVAAGHHGVNPVTWWLLKQRGVAALGPEPRTLPFEADWESVRLYMLGNLESYWRSWSRQPRRLILLLSDWGVSWAVLGVSRLWYGLREGDMISKRGAGEYALAHLAPVLGSRLSRSLLT